MILTAFGFDSVVQLLSRELFTIYTRMLAHTVVERMLHHRTELSLSVTNTLFVRGGFIRHGLWDSSCTYTFFFL